uniref:Pappalysin-1-like n=1 Tax=Knipowitschia caucasica TaxID=637954 RepID=A0AAV2IUM0_KNICA
MLEPRCISVGAGLYDKCFYASSDRGWLLGIQAVSEYGNRDPRFFFSLKTDRAHKVTSVHANTRYTPNQWVHVAITYDGVYMKLYVNAAQVGVSREQSGDVFSHLTKKCKVLMIGGNALNHNYRGAVERLGLWRYARAQRQIIKDMQGHEHPLDLPHLVIRETFEHPERKWLTVKDGTFPQPERGSVGKVVGGVLGTSMTNIEGLLDTTLEPPPCGQTVCDNLQVIKNFNQLWTFRRPKKVRYRVVNIWDNLQKRPTVTDHQISLQHQQLNDAFSPYNITWELSIHNVTNSSLRHRLILANCDISKVGNDVCDPECNHPLTGYDAGDCTLGHRGRCPEHKQGNGICEPECNWENFNFDLGDCCDPALTDVTKTCFNRTSPHRAVTLCSQSSHSVLPESLCAPRAVTLCSQSGHSVLPERSLCAPRAVTLCSQSSHSVLPERSLCAPRAVTLCSQSGHSVLPERSLCVPRAVTLCSQSSHSVLPESLCAPRAVTLCSQSGHSVLPERSLCAPRAVTLCSQSHSVLPEQSL